MKGDWLPKLGDVLSGQRQDMYGSVERRFEEVGFSLQLTLDEQSPGGLGDKNNEERKLQNHSGGTPNMNDSQQTHTAAAHTATPQQSVLEQMQALQAKGAQFGIPVQIILDPKALAESRQLAQPTLGQDLGRFSAKAGIVAILALSGALAYHYVTKPVEPLTPA